MAYPRIKLRGPVVAGSPPPPPPPPPPGLNFDMSGGGTFHTGGPASVTIGFGVIIIDGTPPFSFNWSNGDSASSTSINVTVGYGGFPNSQSGVMGVTVSDSTGASGSGGKAWSVINP